MENKTVKKTRKPKKNILIAVGIFAVLILSFPFLLTIYLKHKLPDLVNEKTNYQLSLKDFDINLFKGNISANELVIKTKPTKDTTVTQINGTIKSLNVENFGIWKAIFNTSYHADDISLIDPQITVLIGKSKEKSKSPKKNVDFGVKNILVTNGNFSVKGSNKKDLFNGKNVNINLTEISQKNDVSMLPVAYKNFKIDAQDIVITVNEFYQIFAKKIDAKNKQFTISEFHLKPIENPYLYNAKNVFDFKVNQLSAHNFAIEEDSLIIENAKFGKPQLIVTSTNKKTVKENQKEINLKIGIKNLDLQEGSVLIQQQDKTKTASIDNFHVNLKDIVFDKNTVKEKLPFKFSTHNVEFKNIYFKANPLQEVSVKKISSNNSDIFITNAEFRALGKSNFKDVYNIKTDKIEILNNKSKFVGQQLQLNLNKINIYRPDIEIIAATGKKAVSQKSKGESPDLMANVSSLNLINGSFSQTKQGAQKMKIRKFNVQLNSITTNKEILKESIPFHVKNRIVTAEKIDIDAGKYYLLKLDEIKNTDKITQIRNFAFLPKYSRNQFNKMIAVEEDLYTIKIKSLNIKDKNSIIGGKTIIDLEQIVVDGINCNIYHDLAPPDDIAIRYMFSKKLRDVKFPLYVKQIDIINSKLTYEEIAEKAQIPGKITFDNFNAKIKDVNNAKITGKPTMIKVDSNFDFFGDAPTDIHWNFDVANKNDDFAINGTIKDLSIENANLFVRPYLNVSLDGKINYLKFDYTGNTNKIGGKFGFNYTDMNVNFLNKNTGKERKVLSAIANIFVKNNSKGEPDHVEVDKDRDPNKSFFNTLWQGIMEGLKKYLI